ncbi:hypothetical protein TNCV_217091 [Trichonephila clavipes]|nr:hypothetical protein TNCV_217091 [Trichonephila clavipes]
MTQQAVRPTCRINQIQMTQQQQFTDKPKQLYRSFADPPTLWPKHPCDGCPARNIRSLVGDMISPETARQVSQRLPMLRMRVSMTWCIVVHEKELQTHSASKKTHIWKKNLVTITGPVD